MVVSRHFPTFFAFAIALQCLAKINVHLESYWRLGIYELQGHRKNATKWKVYSSLQALYYFLRLVNHFSLSLLVFFLLFCFLFLLCSVNLQAVDQDRPLLMINLFWKTISEKEG